VRDAGSQNVPAETLAMVSGFFRVGKAELADGIVAFSTLATFWRHWTLEKQKGESPFELSP
jgi:hypothetical protein